MCYKKSSNWHEWTKKTIGWLWNTATLPPVINLASTVSNISSVTDCVTNWTHGKLLDSVTNTSVVPDLNLVPPTNSNGIGDCGTTMTPKDKYNLHIWEESSGDTIDDGLKIDLTEEEEMDGQELLNIELSGSWDNTDIETNDKNVLEPTCVTNSVTTQIIENTGAEEQIKEFHGKSLETCGEVCIPRYADEEVPVGVMGINRVR